MTAPARRARAALAERLRDLRRSTGLTGDQFAKRLGRGWGQPKVSRIETGKQVPTSADVEEWAAAAGAGVQDLLDMRERAATEYAAFRDRYGETGGAEGFEDALAAADAAAKRIGHYQPAIVLDTLQTADYARAVLHLADGPAVHGADEDEINRKIAARLRRQAIIHEPGRDITLLMSEAALRIQVASPEVMATQCEHIARLAESLTTAVIGIIPFAARMPVYGVTGWVILDDLVTIETEGGDLDIADPEEAGRYWRYTELLRDIALTGSEAGAFCRQVAAETRGQRR